MATAKDGVAPINWNKHLRKAKRQQNKKVRRAGKRINY